MVRAAAVRAHDVDDLLVVGFQSERLGDDVLGDGARWSVDFAHVQTDVAGDLREFFARFLMNHGVQAFAPRKAVVGGRDEHVAAVVPNIATHHSEDAVLARSCHVEFGHRF